MAFAGEKIITFLRINRVKNSVQLQSAVLTILTLAVVPSIYNHKCLIVFDVRRIQLIKHAVVFQ